MSTPGPAPESTNTTSERTPSIDDVLDREQLRDLVFRRWFDLAKTIITIVGAVVAFVLLSRPDSALNHSVSRENVSRERAKLLLEVLREPETLVRGLGLEVISSAYPDDRQWIKDAKDILRLRDRYIVLERRSLELAQLFETMDRERASAADGMTPSLNALLQQAIRATKEMEVIAAEFRKRKVDLPNQNDTPVGCVSLGIRNLGPVSAGLVGAPLGLRSREWFDFDTTQPMRYRVDATDGIGTAVNLRPHTSYFFRYVVQHNDITCFGETKSFTTPLQ